MLHQEEELQKTVLSAVNFARYGWNRVNFQIFTVFCWEWIVEEGDICGRFWFAAGEKGALWKVLSSCGLLLRCNYRLWYALFLVRCSCKRCFYRGFQQFPKMRWWRTSREDCYISCFLLALAETRAFKVLYIMFCAFLLVTHWCLWCCQTVCSRFCVCWWSTLRVKAMILWNCLGSGKVRGSRCWDGVF